MEKVNYKGENGFYDETAGFIPLSAMEKVNSNGQNGYYNEKIGFVPDDLSQQPQQPSPQPSGFMDILKKVAMAHPNMRLAQSLSNAPSDAYNTFIEPFTTPVETAKGLGKLIAGGIRGIPGGANPIKPITDYVIPEEYEKYPEAMIDSYIEKYGSLDKAKQTFEKEPIGTLLDLSTVLTGTGALAQGLKAPKLAAAGKVMSDVGKIIEPLSATTKVLGGALSPLKTINKIRGVESLDRAVTNIFKEEMPKVLKNSSQTYPQLLNQSEKLATAGKDIIANKNNLKYLDADTGVEIVGKLPSNVGEMAQAWHQRMKEVWEEIDNSIKGAGGAGIEIDLSNMVKELEAIASNTSSKVFLPQETKAAKVILEGLSNENLKKLPLAKAQEIIASLNSRMGSLTTYKDIAQSKVDSLVLKNLRGSLDDAILGYKGTGIKDAKKLYGSYLEGEKFLTRALSNKMKQMGGPNFIDIGSAAVAVSSLVSGNVAGLAGPLSAQIFNVIRGNLRNTDKIVNKMFKKAEGITNKKAKYSVPIGARLGALQAGKLGQNQE